MKTSKTWSRNPVPVRNLHVLLNSHRVSSFFRMVLESFKIVGFLWNLNFKLIVIKWTNQKHDQGPPPQSGTSLSSWTLAECHHSLGGFLIPSIMMDFYKTWNLSLLSSKECIKHMIKDSSNIVRSLYILLNSIRVSSFFRRVLDIFKEDVSCSNLRLKSIDIKGKHQQAEHTWFQWPKFGGGWCG